MSHFKKNKPQFFWPAIQFFTEIWQKPGHPCLSLKAILIANSNLMKMRKQTFFANSDLEWS